MTDFDALQQGGSLGLTDLSNLRATANFRPPQSLAEMLYALKYCQVDLYTLLNNGEMAARGCRHYHSYTELVQEMEGRQRDSPSSTSWMKY